jgi:hypothetical protein
MPLWPTRVGLFFFTSRFTHDAGLEKYTLICSSFFIYLPERKLFHVSTPMKEDVMPPEPLAPKPRFYAAAEVVAGQETEQTGTSVTTKDILT